MRFISITLLLACIAAGPLSTGSTADDVLDALDARGKDLRSLSATLKTSDDDPSTGDVADIRTGRLWYVAPPDGDARFRAVFDTKITGRKVEDAKLEWVYGDGKLTERDYRRQTQHTHQVLKPGEKMQLFKLEGPFPLPLGQDKADVHKHFDVQRPAAASDDPPGSIHLLLTPLAGTELARKFRSIDLWINPATALPQRITVLDASGNDLKQTDLSDIKLNDPIAPDNLQLEQTDTGGWNVTDD
jgi:outer membrane lipoprotein-sorting protein